MEMEWSPQNALKAFLQTLHLCTVKNIHEDEVQKYGLDGSKIIEPHGTELISALAAGNQARVILDISISQHQQNGVVTPLTLALAVAANQTGGKLICIRPITHQHSSYKPDHHDDYYASVTELRVGDDPCALVDDVRHVDFAVIDCTGLDPTRLRVLCEKIDLNKKGAIIVANNISCREQGFAIVDQVLKGKRGVGSSVTTLPLGSSGGFQLIIKIKGVNCQRRRRHKRFFVTFDE